MVDGQFGSTPVDTRRVKYVFLDVVGFTRDRSVEAQTDIVAQLNSIIHRAIGRVPVKPEEVVFLPTGDGVCIALLGQSVPYDVHLTLALTILEFLNSYNEEAPDTMRRFAVRIGINENVDNIVVDINGRENVAGAGINIAQRVMAFADGNQILVSPIVFDMLRHRERYMKSFRVYHGVVKHGGSLPVFQFIEHGHRGLSIQPPAAFVPITPPEHRLTLFEAYFIAHALKERQFLRQYRDRPVVSYAGNVWLYFRAVDSIEEEESQHKEYPQPQFRVYGKRNLTREEEFDFYLNLEFWVCATLSDYVSTTVQNIHSYIDDVLELGILYLINEKGKASLKTEHPDIWARFELDKV